MEIFEFYRNIKFSIFTSKKAELWCATAEITFPDEIGLFPTGPKLMLNMPLEDVGVGHYSEKEAINSVRVAAQGTIDSYLRGAGIPKSLPVPPGGIVLRREHFVDTEID